MIMLLTFEISFNNFSTLSLFNADTSVAIDFVVTASDCWTALWAPEICDFRKIISWNHKYINKSKKSIFQNVKM